MVDVSWISLIIVIIVSAIILLCWCYYDRLVQRRRIYVEEEIPEAEEVEMATIVPGWRSLEF